MKWLRAMFDRKREPKADASRSIERLEQRDAKVRAEADEALRHAYSAMDGRLRDRRGGTPT